MGFTIFKTEKLDDCSIINSLSDCILEKTKKTERLTMIGRSVGIIWGNDKKISLEKTLNGSPLPTINSINWTLLARQKREIISINISIELFNSCRKIYLSTKFIE